MNNHNSRLSKLESKQPRADVPAWAEVIGNGRAVLCYQDGRRMEASEADIPQGVKVYRDISPDNWK